MKLFLQYMTDHRYKEILQAELGLIGHAYTIAELEETDLGIAPGMMYKVMNSALEKYEGEGSVTARSLLFAKLKTTVSESIRSHVDGPPYIKYAVYLSETLHHSYHYLSTLFSQMQGSTLEHYIISQRIELVKQMLVKEGLGLSEISWKLGYCSVPHLSNQFKKITGYTPTSYKVMATKRVVPLRILCEPCTQPWMLEGGTYKDQALAEA